MSALVAHPCADPQRAVAVRVGMDDDVGAGLGDRELDVRQRLVGHVEGIAEAAERMAHDRDVLGAGREGELEVGGRRHVGSVTRRDPANAGDRQP